MELRHLRYFVAVAEELHFRRAAERLHVAQPAVSEQVRKLEEELGVRLLDRTQRSVSLTVSGAAMLEEARRVLRQADVAKLAARNARDHATARLRIGYVASSLVGSVPRALQTLAAATPQLETSLEAGSAHDLIEAVRGERLDAAVVPLPAVVTPLRVTSLGEQHAVAALPVGHRDAVKPAISLERLAPERIVLLPRDANRPFHDAVVAACRQADLSPTLVELPDEHVEQALLA
ncbi:MAG: LysR family transcriptional regulator, partial [Thermoleophilaceae bacterium]